MLKKEDVYYTNEEGIGHKMRKARMKIFLDLLAKVPKPVRMLDIGGTEDFWKKMEFDEPQVEIVCANLFTFEPKLPFIKSVKADATNMPEFGDKEFDVVFSNSVIEHVYTLENQVKMANEIRRVGKRYFVQTPSRYFPMEPHFLRIYWQFYPVALRKKMLMSGDVGFIKQQATEEDALREIEEIRLMTEKEMRECFPEASLVKEKFKGLTKSYMVHFGF